MAPPSTRRGRTDAGASSASAPDGIRIAAALHELLLSFGADVTSEWRAGAVRYSRRPSQMARHLSGRTETDEEPSGVPFVIVKPFARRADVGFTKLGRARATRILAAKGRLPFVRHLVEVEALGDIDRELRAWLREAYETAAE
jgi:hypothetical protein